MCRLLYVRKNRAFEISNHLEKFAEIAQNSKEYQGHGWGCSYLEKGLWSHYKNISPIWEDDLNQFGKSSLLIAHARSAFQDKDIVVENNMPFFDDNYVFIFNGELHGVRINEVGRIGAEKIFNFIKRFNKGDMLAALDKGRTIINKRSKYVKAMNIILADKKRAYICSEHNEDKDYFTLHYKQTDDELIICSMPYPEGIEWQTLENKTVKVF